jgi:uroporphyrinogen III methyltransferase/synthase
MTGRVVLVGAGPGDPDLLTVRAVRELGLADVLLYDALLDPVILELANPACERIDVGKRGDGSKGVAQDEIAALLVAKAREGHHVVRLKGGDPFVFGRGGEEASALREAGIPFEVVPGVTSAIAVPAYAGIPVTDRRYASSVAVITGHRGKDLVDRRIDWEGLARSAETLVILMGTAWIDDIVARIIEGGRDPRTPAAAIASGTTPRQRVVTAPLAELPARIREAGLRAPTITVVGEVTRFRDALAWYERRPLFGKRVLVGRAVHQQGPLATELRRRGADPVVVPLLELVPPEDPQRARVALARAAEYDWLVFTSANAVQFSAPHLPERARMTHVRVACVGPATERAAREAGFAVHAMPSERALPEDLVVAMVAKGSLEGARVLFPRAAVTREALVEGLLCAGARVDAVDVYRTVLPEAARGRVLEAFASGLDIVTLTSASSVRHLLSILETSGRGDALGGVCLACIGPMTARALRDGGYEPHIVADPYTAEGLVDALERHFADEAEERRPWVAPSTR